MTAALYFGLGLRLVVRADAGLDLDAWDPCPQQVVVDRRARLIFVDNVKAGSSSVRAFFKSRNASWDCEEHMHRRHRDPTAYDGCGFVWKLAGDRPGTGCRTTAGCFEQSDGWIWFAMTRHPVSKFESGCCKDMTTDSHPPRA